MLEINKAGTVLLTGKKNDLKILLGCSNPNFKSERKKRIQLNSLHLPAGMIDEENLNPETEALRELQEETGGFFICNKLHPDTTEKTNLGQIKVDKKKFHCLNKKPISIEMVKQKSENAFKVNFNFFLYHVENLKSEKISDTCRQAIKKLDDKQFKHYKEMLDWHEIDLNLFLEKLKIFDSLTPPTRQWYYQGNLTSKYDQIISFEINNKTYTFNKGYFSALSQTYKQILKYTQTKS